MILKIYFIKDDKSYIQAFANVVKIDFYDVDKVITVTHGKEGILKDSFHANTIFRMEIS